MTFLWTARNSDSTIDVPNFESNNRHVPDDHDHKSAPGTNRSKQSKRRMSSILKQIDANPAKRGSVSSVASGSYCCDEVSVLSLHSAFMTNKMPIKEDAEFTTPLIVNGGECNRSFNLMINTTADSNRSLNHRRSHLKSTRHTSSSSSMTFSEKSLPISQEDIDCVEQSWMDKQQGDQHSHRSSATGSSRGNGKRRFSTQTYSDKGTLYSSIYKSFCDEESARSVASISSNAKNNSPMSNLHAEDSILSKQQTYDAYFRSNNTVGSARICTTIDKTGEDSTPTTLTSAASSKEMSQYQDVNLDPPTSVAKDPTEVRQPKLSRKDEDDSLPKVTKRIHRESSFSKKKKKRSEKKIHTDRSVMSTSSHHTKKKSSHSYSSDNTLLHQNSKSSGKPPLSSKSSSSSLTDETTESKVQKELYRLSLELASTLSSLDFKKLEVTKYVKQVGELEKVIAKLVIEKEQLETKLERYEMKERNAQRYRENQNDLIHSTSKKMIKTDEREMVGEINHTQAFSNAPNCVTPTNGDEEINDNPATPSLTSPKIETNRVDESDILFPDLNESHITCQDLYATMDVDGEDDEQDDQNLNSNKYSSDAPVSNGSQEDKDLCIDDEDGDNDDEFPTDVLDTTVSLIDPREEVFDDDPFATVYDYGESPKSASREKYGEYDNASLYDNRSVISLQWIPFLNKDSLRVSNQQSIQLKRVLREDQSRMKYSDVNASFGSTKTNMTAPVKKSNFFGFAF